MLTPDMLNPWWQNFWLWFTAMMVAGCVISTWIRAKYGYSLNDGMGRRIEPAAQARKLEQALTERDRKIAQLEERIRVLERIVTDTHKSHTLSEEIESLRTREARF